MTQVLHNSKVHPAARKLSEREMLLIEYTAKHIKDWTDWRRPPYAYTEACPDPRWWPKEMKERAGIIDD